MLLFISVVVLKTSQYGSVPCHLKSRESKRVQQNFSYPRGKMVLIHQFIIRNMFWIYIDLQCQFICILQVGWSLYELRPPLGPPYLVWDFWYTLCTCWRKPQHWRHFQLGLCLLQVTFEHIFFVCMHVPVYP